MVLYGLVESFVPIFKQVPSPRDVSDEELADIIQSGDPMRYRVPMSIGEPHVEVDNGIFYMYTYKLCGRKVNNHWEILHQIIQKSYLGWGTEALIK